MSNQNDELREPKTLAEFSSAVMDLLYKLRANIPTQEQLEAVPPAELETRLAEWTTIDGHLMLSMGETVFWLNKKIKSLEKLRA